MYHASSMSAPATDKVVFGQVPSTAAEEAYSFHRSITLTNEHIWPREAHEIQNFATNGELFGAWRGNLSPFVCMCYVKSDADGKEFEFGGLSTAPDKKGVGIATALTNFALAYTLVYSSPSSPRQIIAHVHESNNEPRGLLQKVGFQFSERVEYSGSGIPPTMKRNEAGNVVGDKFHFTIDGIHRICAWFTKEFRGILRDGTRAEFDLGPEATLDELKRALMEFAASLD